MASMSHHIKASVGSADALFGTGGSSDDFFGSFGLSNGDTRSSINSKRPSNTNSIISNPFDGIAEEELDFSEQEAHLFSPLPSSSAQRNLPEDRNIPSAHDTHNSPAVQPSSNTF